MINSIASVILIDEGQAGRSPSGTEGQYQNYYHKSKGYSTIYNSRYGVYLVAGDTRDKHESLEGTWGWLGFPKSDARYAKSSCGNGGWYQEFESGKVYTWSGGVYFIDKNILKQYEGLRSMTWSLGWPYSDINILWVLG